MMALYLSSETRARALDRLADIMDGPDTELPTQRLAAAELLIADGAETATPAEAHHRALQYLDGCLGGGQVEHQIRAAELLLRVPLKRRSAGG